MKHIPLLFAACFAGAVAAEEASYGVIDLSGLARLSWDLNPLGQGSTLVCNVNGPDGFLSIRSGPGTNHQIKRKLNRLATVVVDTRYRQGNWIKVTDAFREYSKDGERIAYKSLHVTGWAHDGYLCDFIDY